MPISSLKKFINISTVIYIIRSFRQSRSNSQILSFFLRHFVKKYLRPFTIFVKIARSNNPN